MTWNWQQADWPTFSWDQALPRHAEEEFLRGSGTVAGALKYLGAEDRERLTVEMMSEEALTTSEIEGEILDRASVQSLHDNHRDLVRNRDARLGRSCR